MEYDSVAIDEIFNEGSFVYSIKEEVEYQFGVRYIDEEIICYPVVIKQIKDVKK